MSEPNIAFVANLMADPSRAAMCQALAGGEARPAGELAARAGVSAQTASNHLAKLVAGRILRVEQQGRWRYYRLAGAEVGHVVEALAVVAPPLPSQAEANGHDGAARRLKDARTCYSHLAGRLGVALADALVGERWLEDDGRGYRVTARAGHRGERPARAGARAAMSGLDGAAAPRGRPRGHGARGAGAEARLGAPPARHPRAARHAVGSHAAAARLQSSLPGGSAMITLSIRYTIEARKRPDFERYARTITKIVPRCGGELVGYWLPTKYAGPTNEALALISFPSLAAYEQYRERLAKDADSIEAIRRAEESACILVEDRAILEPVSS